MAISLQDAVAGSGLVTFLQPIVSLNDRSVVGYEALTRWPLLNDATPAVFEYAVATRQVDQLERLCIEGAVTAADRAGIDSSALLTIHCEVASRYVDRSGCPVLDSGSQRYTVMFELTERDLLHSPKALLRKVDALRDDGFAVAVDDVGVNRDSCALLDVIRPDVVKLDLDLVQSRPSTDRARTLTAVLAHRERYGAVILAEGIETDEHVERAVALGAELGQGYLFGRPVAAPCMAPVTSFPLREYSARPLEGARTPFEAVAGRGDVRTARKDVLVAFSRLIEQQVMDAQDNPLVFTSLQHRRFFTGRTRRSYLDLGATCPLVTVFGQGLDGVSEGATRFVDVRADDPLAEEWLVVALGGHTAVALMARQRGDADLPDGERYFDFIITQDRALVVDAVRHLMDRIP